MAIDGLRSYGVHEFSLDGEFFYYEDSNNVVRRMPTDLEEVVALAKASATRILTDDEWPPIPAHRRV